MALVYKGEMPSCCAVCCDCNSAKDGNFCNRTGNRLRNDWQLCRPLNCPIIGELPDKHGRIVDLDKVLDWLINEDGRFSMATCAKIDNALKNAPILLKASATTPSKNRTCPYYQGVCGLDEDILCYCHSSYETCDTYKEASE